MTKFTDTYIKNLKTTDKRYEKYEGGGFGIRIAPSGIKTWLYRYKTNGQTEKLSIGRYPSTSLANARSKFHELSSLKRDGTNPRTHILQKKHKQTNTVKKLFIDWYERYAEKHRKKPHQIKQQITADIVPLLGNIPLEKLQTIDVTNALDKIVSRGARIHANRVLSTIKQALNYGVSRGSLASNPAALIRSRDIGGIEKPRERVLSLEEIKCIWHFLDTDESRMSLHIRIAIKIILLTGVRTSELRLAKWNEINFDQSLWIIPAANTKCDQIVKVHLSKQVQALFLLLTPLHDGYVIYGQDSRKSLSENALARAIARIQQRVGIPKWTAHDMRRTFATHLGETLRIDPVVIEKCLGHKMPRIMATYNKNEMLPERKAALDKWAERITKLLIL